MMCDSAKHSHAVCSMLIGSTSFSNIQSAWSKERDCCSLTHEIAPKAVFLENLLAVSAWILNGSSIEYHENKRQPFSLPVVRFGSQVILISG